MAILNGTVYLLSVGGTALPDQTEGSISINMETRDITTKDSSGYRELLEGLRSGSVSVSGLVDDDASRRRRRYVVHYAQHYVRLWLWCSVSTMRQTTTTTPATLSALRWRLAQERKTTSRTARRLKSLELSRRSSLNESHAFREGVYFTM